MLYYLQETERVPSSLASLLVPWLLAAFFGQPMPITTHWPIGQVMLYQWMQCNWHRLAKKAAKTNSSGEVIVPWWQWQQHDLWLWVSIVQYTSCRVWCTNNTPTLCLWNIPLIFCNDKMMPHTWWAQRNNLLTGEVILQGWTVGKRRKQGFNFWGMKSRISGTLVHTTLLDS